MNKISYALRGALLTSTQMVIFKYDPDKLMQRPTVRYASFDGEGGGTEDNIINVYV